jgi:hypothetical protein
MLVPAGEHGVLEAARDAQLLVVGLSERWQSEGIGRTRLAVAAGAGVPIDRNAGLGHRGLWECRLLEDQLAVLHVHADRVAFGELALEQL